MTSVFQHFTSWRQCSLPGLRSLTLETNASVGAWSAEVVTTDGEIWHWLKVDLIGAMQGLYNKGAMYIDLISCSSSTQQEIMCLILIIHQPKSPLSHSEIRIVYRKVKNQFLSIRSRMRHRNADYQRNSNKRRSSDSISSSGMPPYFYLFEQSLLRLVC